MSYPYYDYAVLGDACTPHSMAILNNTKFLEPNSEVYKIYYTQMYREPIDRLGKYKKGFHPFPGNVVYPEHTKAYSGKDTSPMHETAYDDVSLVEERYQRKQSKPGKYNMRGGCTSCSLH